MKDWIAFSLGGVLAAGTVWFLMRSTPASPPARVEISGRQAPTPVALPEPGALPRAAALPRIDVPPPPAPQARQKANKPFTPPALVRRAPEPAAPQPTTAALPPPPPPVTTQESAPPPLPTPPTPAPAPPPVRVARVVTIMEGTLIPVRLAQALSSENNLSGDAFQATLDEPIVIDGLVIAEKGSRVEGKVVAADRGGRTRGLAKLSIELVRFHTADGQQINLQTTTFSKNGPTTTKEDAAKVGLGAGIGAAIGSIAGGGKGAAIGAAAGGAAGAGAVLGTRGKPAELAVETRISFRLSEPIKITEKLP